MVFCKIFFVFFFFAKELKNWKIFIAELYETIKCSILNFSKVYLNIMFQSMFNNDNWIILLFYRPEDEI